MAGIYIHIPYCTQACHYCDFHFSTNLTGKSEMVDCLIRELEMQSSYLNNLPIDTVYFGGGTPSLLSELELNAILHSVRKIYSVNKDAEITLEANPENITAETLDYFSNSGINRLSIGIQSFDDKWLKHLNRVHSSKEAIKSLETVADSKISNYSLDLIFGIKENDTEVWEKDLATALEFEPKHLSAYNLTIEPKTVFGNWLNKGKIESVSDEHCARIYDYNHHLLCSKGYDHYEISNFALAGHHSKHNTSYWSDTEYLGIGPGAHSYNKLSRQYNVSHNHQYVQAIRESKLQFNREVLSLEDKVNESIITGLRTKWGCDLSYLKEKWGYDLLKKKNSLISKLLNNDFVEVKENKLYLKLKGQLVADSICSDLMIETT